MKRLLLAFILACVPALASAQSPSPYTALPTQPLAPAIVVFPGSANQVLAVDGTAANPSMSFASQSDLGFYKLSSTSIGFTSAGSAIGFMNSGGIAFTAAGAGLYLGPSQDTILQRGGAAGKVVLIGTTPMLQLGCATSSCPALKQSANNIQVRAADDSTFVALTAGNLLATSGIYGGNLWFATTAPTISSGFGTSPSIASNNGTAAFTVNVGTGATASSGVIGMPAATNGWACNVNMEAVVPTTLTKQTGNTTTTVTVTNYTVSTGATAAWAASAVLTLTCTAR